MKDKLHLLAVGEGRDEEQVPKCAPRLSIIIATWNAAETLSRCTRSIQMQTFREWELLIADSSSTDGTVALIQECDVPIAWWVSEADSGIYDAWNKALAHARGEYVTFLGADDALHGPNTLATIFDIIGDQHYDLITGRGVLVNQKGPTHYEFGNPFNYRKLARKMTICHPGSFHRRDLFQRYGLFDTSYRISADYEFLLRLPRDIRSLHLNFPITNIADNGISRSTRWVMLKERYRAQASCPRIGRFRAAFNYIDKLWRIPVAKLLGIPN